MNRCAIIITKKINNFDKNLYSCFIGCEQGSIFLLKNNFKNSHYISDFDSIDNKLFKKIKNKNRSIIMNDETKQWSDGEEAIIYAINKLKFSPKKIDIFVNDIGRNDHFVNMFRVVYKYGCYMYGNLNKISRIEAKKDTKIINNYKFLSIFVFENTYIKTSGLKWDIDKEYDQFSGTNLISNKVLNKTANIFSSNNIVTIESNE